MPYFWGRNKPNDKTDDTNKIYKNPNRQYPHTTDRILAHILALSAFRDFIAEPVPGDKVISRLYLVSGCQECERFEPTVKYLSAIWRRLKLCSRPSSTLLKRLISRHILLAFNSRSIRQRRTRGVCEGFLGFELAPSLQPFRQRRIAKALKETPTCR